jgi:hypothetical protein
MSDGEKYLLVELSVTFILLAAPLILLASVAGGSFIFILELVGLGFAISWFLRERLLRYASLLIVLGTCGVLIWMVKSILGSTFLYKDVVVICIKGLMFLEIVLSFCACSSLTIGYPQIVSLPLFLCYPTLGLGYDTPILIAIGAYCLCWLLILKVKFYAFLKKPFSEINLKQNLVLIGITVTLIFFVSALLYFKFPLRALKVDGIFSDVGGKGTAGIDTEADSYYSLQDKILKNSMKLIPHLRFSEDRYSLLQLLDYLIKESSSIREVEKAESGLISYLRIPGPGLDKSEAEDTIVKLQQYVALKIEKSLQQHEQEMRETMRQEPFNLKGAVSVSSEAHKVSVSKTDKELKEKGGKLKAKIDDSSFSSETKQELQGEARDLKEWKYFDLYHKKTFALLEKEGSSRVEEVLQSFSEAARSASGPESPDEETVEQIAYQEQGPAILEADQEKPEEEKKEENPVEDESGVTQGKRRRLFLLGIGIALVCAMCAFFILYLLTLRRRRQLLYFFERPRVFIPRLYAHVRNLLMLFGVRPASNMAPLAFAAFIERCYAIQDSTFSIFSAKFAEAHYSSHELSLDDSMKALKQYNDFLGIVSRNASFFRFCWVYSISLFKRQPLFIPMRSLLVKRK